MDMTDAAGFSACIKKRTVAIDKPVKPPCQFGNGSGIENVGIDRHRLGIAADDLANTGSAIARPCDLRLCVETDKGIGQLLQRRFVESVPVCQITPERAVRKALHLQNPVHRLAIALDGKLAVLVPIDRMHRLVEIRRGPPIELEFGFQSHPALVGRGKVEIAEVHRLLDLPGRLAAQEDARGMGVDAADRPARSEGFTGSQPFRQIGRISHGHQSQRLPVAG
ncbi:hypothetical protein D9M73_78880 [compost metagenome]